MTAIAVPLRGSEGPFSVFAVLTDHCVRRSGKCPEGQSSVITIPTASSLACLSVMDDSRCNNVFHILQYHPSLPSQWAEGQLIDGFSETEPRSSPVPDWLVRIVSDMLRRFAVLPLQQAQWSVNPAQPLISSAAATPAWVQVGAPSRPQAWSGRRQCRPAPLRSPPAAAPDRTADSRRPTRRP